MLLYLYKKSTHSKADAPGLRTVFMNNAYPVVRQDRHLYLFLSFLLSRKASNAMIKQPKDINNANIPIKIETVS